MAPVPLTAGNLADLLGPVELAMISGCAAESALLADLLFESLADGAHLTLSGVFVPGFNRTGWIAAPQARALTFFQTPELRAAATRVEFLPLCYQDIMAQLRARRPGAALVMLSPPDADGWCSFGTEQGFVPDLWNDIPIRIGHLNPAMPRTPGHRGVRFDSLTACIEAEAPLLALPPESPDPATAAIGDNVAGLIPDGATLQTGLGKVMTAVLAALAGRRDLRLHTGLIGDGVIDLIESGALAGRGRAVVGAAIGNEALYRRLDDPVFDFQPVSVTHDPLALARHTRFVSINSAIEIDLFGQAYAELTPKGLMSGPGGASDFARGARLGSGLRIVALPAAAQAGKRSRIVVPGAGAGPVSLGRTDVDVVVTEHGAADLRGKDHAGRAQALIAIAAPDHRDHLADGWRALAARL